MVTLKALTNIHLPGGAVAAPGDIITADKWAASALVARGEAEVFNAPAVKQAPVKESLTTAATVKESLTVREPKKRGA